MQKEPLYWDKPKPVHSEPYDDRYDEWESSKQPDAKEPSAQKQKEITEFAALYTAKGYKQRRIKRMIFNKFNVKVVD